VIDVMMGEKDLVDTPADAWSRRGNGVPVPSKVTRMTPF
jgi:hypothetical protein